MGSFGSYFFLGSPFESRSPEPCILFILSSSSLSCESGSWSSYSFSLSDKRPETSASGGSIESDMESRTALLYIHTRSSRLGQKRDSDLSQRKQPRRVGTNPHFSDGLLLLTKSLEWGVGCKERRGSGPISVVSVSREQQMDARHTAPGSDACMHDALLARRVEDPRWAEIRPSC